MTRLIIYLIGILSILCTGGCGDSNTTPTTTSTAEGLWVGNTNTNRTLTATVLDDDSTYYLFYSAVANAGQIAGVIQGTGTANTSGSFSSTNARDFGIGVNAQDASISATFGTRQFFNGSINYSAGGTVTFATSYNTAYDTQPTVASLAGVYQGQAGSSGGIQTATVTVATDGTFTGTEQSGCTFTGKATLRTRGNILDQTVTFGGAPCFFAGSTLQGIVYFDIPTRRLFSAAPNSARTDAAIFFGTRTI